MELPGGAPRGITTDTAHEQVPTWSPDGLWLAYVTWTEDGGRLMKVRADGKGAAVQLTPDVAFYDAPVGSPHGHPGVFVNAPRAPPIPHPSPPPSHPHQPPPAP